MADTDQLLEATTALIPPLLNALDALQHAGRYMHPPNLPEVVAAIAEYQPLLEEGRAVFDAVAWPDHLEEFVFHAQRATTQALRAFVAYSEAATQVDPSMSAYRAMGLGTKAYEAAYPLAGMLPPVSRYYLEPAYREHDDLLAKLAAADAQQPNVGVMHADNASNERGGFSLYVPEYYAGEAVPLVMALHGGSGHGRNFLWSWLRAARSVNAIVISPTSSDRTWSLMQPEADSARLTGLVNYAKEHWNIDEQRILLTGMSDGGTFSYVSGLAADSPFTHLAPCSASFHPMLMEVVDAERIKGLPVYLIHGALDWMFPVSVAQEANASLSAAGADVLYREIPDLSHTYPSEESIRILDWLNGESSGN